MANIHFLRKFACDEMFDTMFFATGERVVKEKTKDYVIMKAGQFTLKVYHTKRIYVNNVKFPSITQAKLAIQHEIQLT